MWSVPFLLGSPSAPITFPSARMLPVLRMRSDPARSTKWNLEERICRLPLVAREPPRRCSMRFIWVAPVCRAVFPESKRLKTSSSPSTSHSLTPHRTMGKHGKTLSYEHHSVPFLWT
uniref:Secreted protein n=1 Tax=Pygocentrus nattereri TaxID=42514 RepID=A0A3B4CB65_PYGNA